MKKGHGKTYQLIKKSSLTGDYIVCHSMYEAASIHHEAHMLGFVIPFPLTYDEFLGKKI